MWWTAQKWFWLMYYKAWLRKEFKNGLVKKKSSKQTLKKKKVWISELLWSCFLCLSYKKLPWLQISFNKSATQFVSKMKTTVILGKKNLQSLSLHYDNTYRLWSFKLGIYTKLGRFLPKSEQIQRKFLLLLKLKKRIGPLRILHLTFVLCSASQKWGGVKFIYSEKATQFLRDLHRRFVLCSNHQIYGGDFAKFCGLLRIYEL